MPRIIAVDVTQVAQTQQKLKNVAADTRNAIQNLASYELPGSQLAAPFSSELDRFFNMP